MAGGGTGGAYLGITIQAKDEASHALHAVHEEAGGLGEKIGELGGIAAAFTMGGMISQLGGGLAGAIEGSVEKMSELGAETGKLSRITGESAETTSTLLSVFEKFGIPVTAAATSLGIFAKHLSGSPDALDENMDQIVLKASPFSNALDKIGVKMQDATGAIRPMAEVLAEAHAKLDGMPESMENTALAAQIFGGAAPHVDKFRDTLAQLNISMIDSNGNARAMADVMMDADLKLRTMPDSLEKSAQQMQLFGGSTKNNDAFIKQFSVSVQHLNDMTASDSFFLKAFAKEADNVAKGPSIKGFAAVMEGLGVNFKDATGKVLPMDQVLGDVADKFKEMPDGAEKTADAMAIFGKAGKDMIPVLDLGKEGMKDMQDEAKKLGLSLTGENVAQIKQYSMAQKEMGEAVGGLQLQLGLLLLPALLAVSTEIASAAAAINQTVIPAFKFFSDNIEHNSTVLTALTVVLTPLVLALGAQAAATVAATIATIPAIAETAAWTAGQWLLNAALTANPIGIVVVAIAALVAGLIVAYETSATFRNIVDTAFKAVSGFVQTLVEDFNILLGVVKQVYGFMTTPIQLPNVAAIAGQLHLPGFADGGTVPGAIGAPMLAVVHGGETVTPAGQGGGHTIIINMNGTFGDANAAKAGAHAGVTAALQAQGLR